MLLYISTLYMQSRSDSSLLGTGRYNNSRADVKCMKSIAYGSPLQLSLGVQSGLLGKSRILDIMRVSRRIVDAGHGTKSTN